MVLVDPRFDAERLVNVVLQIKCLQQTGITGDSVRSVGCDAEAEDQRPLRRLERDRVIASIDAGCSDRNRIAARCVNRSRRLAVVESPAGLERRDVGPAIMRRRFLGSCLLCAAIALLFL